MVIRCSYAVVAVQKAQITYGNILRLSDDPDINDAIRFLHEHGIVHYQRFRDAVRLAKKKMDQKSVYFMNPTFDK